MSLSVNRSVNRSRHLLLRAARTACLAASVALHGLLPGLPCVHAQQIELGANPPSTAAKGGHVLLVSDAVAVQAGKPQTVELRFRVDPGFHINSHKPADELMIATSLKLDPNPHLRVVDAVFPPGTPFRLQVGAGELLDVYQGEFRVVLRLASVTAGESTLSGRLRYQACDNAACFPPKALPVRVAVTAR